MNGLMRFKPNDGVDRPRTDAGLTSKVRGSKGGMTMTPQRFMALGLLAVALVFSSQTLSSKALWAAEESL